MDLFDQDRTYYRSRLRRPLRPTMTGVSNPTRRASLVVARVEDMGKIVHELEVHMRLLRQSRSLFTFANGASPTKLRICRSRQSRRARRNLGSACAIRNSAKLRVSEGICQRRRSPLLRLALNSVDQLK